MIAISSATVKTANLAAAMAANRSSKVQQGTDLFRAKLDDVAAPHTKTESAKERHSRPGNRNDGKNGEKTPSDYPRGLAANRSGAATEMQASLIDTDSEAQTEMWAAAGRGKSSLADPCDSETSLGKTGQESDQQATASRFVEAKTEEPIPSEALSDIQAQLAGADIAMPPTGRASQTVAELEAMGDPILKAIQATLASQMSAPSLLRGSQASMVAMQEDAEVSSASSVKAARDVSTGMTPITTMALQSISGEQQISSLSSAAAGGKRQAGPAGEGQSKGLDDSVVSEKSRGAKDDAAISPSQPNHNSEPETLPVVSVPIASVGSAVVTAAVAAANAAGTPHASVSDVASTSPDRLFPQADLHAPTTLSNPSLPDSTLALSNVGLTQRMGQTEMTIGLHSAEFGMISIRTSTGPERISAEVSVDHGELASVLLDHLPTIQSHSSQDRPIELRVQQTSVLHAGAGMSSGSGGNQRGAEQRSYRTYPSATVTVSNAASFAAAPSPPAVITLSRSSYLDIRV